MDGRDTRSAVNRLRRAPSRSLDCASPSPAPRLCHERDRLILAPLHEKGDPPVNVDAADERHALLMGTAVRVYRLAAGEALFPPAGAKDTIDPP